MPDKEYVSANELVRESFMLANEIYESGYRPEVLLVLWRGGTPVGVVVHEFLLYKGIDTYHAAFKATSYTGIGKRIEPEVEHLASVLDVIRPGQRVLLIDDVFDTGSTIEKVCERLSTKTQNVKIATLYFKPGNNRTNIVPDFYRRETDRWIVFPHELMDLSLHDIRAKDEFVHALLTE